MSTHSLLWWLEYSVASEKGLYYQGEDHFLLQEIYWEKKHIF